MGNIDCTEQTKIVTQIYALAPMCQFYKAKSLCPPNVLFFRARYDWLNSELDMFLKGIR